MRLADQTALITGGTSGIGEATALLFAREGAQVAITGRDERRGQPSETSRRMAAKPFSLVPMSAKLPIARTSVRETVQTFTRLDILFNNAGVFYPHDIWIVPKKNGTSRSTST